MRWRTAISVALALLLPPFTVAPVEAAAVVPARSVAAAHTALPLAKAKTRTGSLKITVTGLAKNIKAKITVAGPSGKKSVTKSTTLKKLKVGAYVITVRDLDEGTFWYLGAQQSTKKKVKSGKTTSVAIRYGKKAKPTPLRFNLKGAVGVAIASGTGTSGTAAASARVSSTAAAGPTLLAVHANGTTSSAISSGRLVAPQKTYVGPDGAVVLEFGGPVSPVTGALDSVKGCALLQIPAGSSMATCVDPLLDHMISRGNLGYAENPLVQFDDSGAVYYAGVVVENRGDKHKPEVSKVVFRRASGSTLTDIAPTLIRSTVFGSGFDVSADFAVTGSGTVYFTGTRNTPYGEVYRVDPDGTATPVILNTNIGFLSIFSDGNLYFGTSVGVRRYLAAEDRLDPDVWLGVPRWSPDATVDHSCEDLAAAATDGQQTDCPSLTYPRSVVTTSAGHSIGPIDLSMSGGNWSNLAGGVVVRYYPDPALIRSSIKISSAAVAAGDEVILAGTDVSGTPRLVALNDTTGSERALLDSDTVVDIYHLTFSASRNLVMFDGLSFANNSYVIGTVDLSSGNVQLAAATKLSDFQGL